MNATEQLLSNIETVGDLRSLLRELRDELIYKGVIGLDDQLVLTNREGTALLSRASLPN